jgi:hypothetical protein
MSGQVLKMNLRSHPLKFINSLTGEISGSRGGVYGFLLGVFHVAWKKFTDFSQVFIASIIKAITPKSL